MKTQNKKKLFGKPRGCLGWGLLVLSGLAGLFVLLFLAACTVEKITLARIPEKYPAPGELVSINTRPEIQHVRGEEGFRQII
jgi:hypothetical protein